MGARGNCWTTKFHFALDADACFEIKTPEKAFLIQFPTADIKTQWEDTILRAKVKSYFKTLELLHPRKHYCQRINPRNTLLMMVVHFQENWWMDRFQLLC